jgi:hypothetical protein
MKWDDSDMLMGDLELGWERVKREGIEVIKVRVSGGEPLLHPRFSEMMLYIGETWNKEYRKGARTCVFTNGTVKRPPRRGWRYRTMPMSDRPRLLIPTMVSPSDLGMRRRRGHVDQRGMMHSCRRQFGCGRLFDAFGFSFCVVAGAMGRLLGEDPYSSRPVVHARRDFCGHCPFGFGIRNAHRLFQRVWSGKVEYPTKTYRAALERVRAEGPMQFKKFQERL